jgi:cytoskeletal protein CcmA (bactofilin family)
MWGQEKKETAEVNEREDNTEGASEHSGQGAQDISAFVGKGVEFKGTISYSGTVRIDGYLDGEIHTDGVLLIGEDAVLQAKITAGNGRLQGKSHGRYCRQGTGQIARSGCGERFGEDPTALHGRWCAVQWQLGDDTTSPSSFATFGWHDHPNWGETC